MNLYLISQTKNIKYETYDSAVVCAESEGGARLIHPGYDGSWDDTWYESDFWVALKDVKVKLLGKANPSIKKGVICASYNAG